MLIGARQGCVDGETLEQKMSALKQLRYDFLELALTQDEIAALGPDSTGTFGALCERTGLPILSTSMGHFTGFASAPPARRAELAAHIRALTRLTRALGADAILLAVKEEAPVEQAAAIYREELRPLADEAQALGATFALEHVGGYLPARLAELVAAVDHPGIRVYYDMGNALGCGENPIEQARICAPLTAQLHIKGGPTTPLAAMPLVPIREVLEGAGFRGRGCLEIAAMPRNRHLADARGVLMMAGYW
ncbi:MAG TPA: sugar phosphate isomerase/epimerase family protein [Limnochordia bacterium]|nr:sugar phosphate isomerase/epimerase family protein [Limnochordia bacterium]